MEGHSELPLPLYTFWEPFVGSRMDIWDVWSLQCDIVFTLVVQGVITIGMLCGLLFPKREFQWMRADLRQERSTYLHTGVITSDAPRICATLLNEDARRRQYDLKSYIRQLGKELEEYKERFRATQGLLVVLKDHTAPLLGKVPECLRGIQASLNGIEETFDETLKNHMESLLAKLQSFELEFQGQREKIPDALRRQNQSVERACVSVASALQEIQTGLDSLGEAEDSKLSGPLTWLCDTVHALDNKLMTFAENQDQLTKQVAKVNARRDSLRASIQDMESAVQQMSQAVQLAGVLAH